jgi:hypothetical protein
MPRNVRTARGDIVDFDAIIIKQQIAQAPMNIEVARRKEFIDSKEGKVRGAKKQELVETPAVEPINTASEFEVDEKPKKKTK